MLVEITKDMERNNKFFLHFIQKMQEIKENTDKEAIKSLLEAEIEIEEEEVDYDEDIILERLENWDWEDFDGIIINDYITIRGEDENYAYVSYIWGNLGFKGKIWEIIENYFSDIDYSEFSEDIFEQIENLQEDVNKLKRKAYEVEKEMLKIIVTNLEDKIDLTEEDVKIIKENIDTWWKASFWILDILWYELEEDIEDEGLPRIIKKENTQEIWEEEIEEIEELLKRMQVAGKRHKLSDYDSIDKSKMSDEEVKRLRSYYNWLVGF